MKILLSRSVYARDLPPTYYNVSTEEQLQRAAHKILTDLFKRGFYPKPEEPIIMPELVDFQLLGLNDEHVELERSIRQTNKNRQKRYEEDVEVYGEILKAVENPELAWPVLQFCKAAGWYVEIINVTEA